MNKINIAIVGASGHAKVVIDILKSKEHYEIIGLISNCNDDNVCGYKVLGNDDIATDLVKQYNNLYFIVAIGDNNVRQKVVANYTAMIDNIQFANAIHPSAVISQDARIGVGCVVMAGVVINAGSEIGSHVIINTNSSIDHENYIANYASIAPGVAMGGNCRVGECSSIGIGACIIHKISIGSNTVIGAGSVVVANCEDDSLYYGVPANKIRNRTKNEKYL